MILARDHIKRPTRMDQPHRPRQRHFISLDEDQFALDAAELRLVIAGGKPAAIDHETVDVIGRDIAVEHDGAAGGDDALMQLRQHAARLDMALARKEQSLAETSLQRWLERFEAGRIEPPVAFGQSRKALEIAAVARMRH